MNENMAFTFRLTFYIFDRDWFFFKNFRKYWFYFVCQTVLLFPFGVGGSSSDWLWSNENENIRCHH